MPTAQTALPAGPLTPPSLSSVHPLETPVTTKPRSPFADTPPPVRVSDGTFRHSSWRHDRDRIQRALGEVAEPLRRQEAFASCGDSFWILRDRRDPRHFRLAADFCHDRFCVPCARARAALLRRNLESRLTSPPYRFLTLTLRATPEPLSDTITRLYRCFRRLRTRALWRERVSGGCAFLELTRNAATSLWHPHLHVILEGAYLPQPALAHLWLQVTGDSSIVDIRFIRSSSSAIHYVAGYVSKTLPSSVLRDPDSLKTAILALKGRRLLLTFGTWARWRLLKDPDATSWDLCFHLAELRLKRLDGDPVAVAVSAYLSSLPPTALVSEFWIDIPPPLVEDTPCPSF